MDMRVKRKDDSDPRQRDTMSIHRPRSIHGMRLPGVEILPNRIARLEIALSLFGFRTVGRLCETPKGFTGVSQKRPTTPYFGGLKRAVSRMNHRWITRAREIYIHWLMPVT